MVAGRNAERFQSEGDVPNALGERAVRDRLIDAADFRLQCVRLVVLFDRLDKQLRERGRMLRHGFLTEC